MKQYKIDTAKTEQSNSHNNTVPNNENNPNGKAKANQSKEASPNSKANQNNETNHNTKTKKNTKTNNQNNNETNNKKPIIISKISVRNIVEFILNSGDIDNTHPHSDPDAMKEGTRLHRKIQKKQKAGYRSEVMLSHTSIYEMEDAVFEVTVEGRADGIFTLTKEEREKDTETSQISFGSEGVFNEELDIPEDKPEIFIDEIKCVYRELSRIHEMVSVHRAQAMCYAYMYCMENNSKRIGIRLSYCNIVSENMKYFEEYFDIKELKKWYNSLLTEYVKWLYWQYKWRIKRNKSIKMLEFPFEYRKGQRELVSGVYKTIIRDKNLFIEAPTGVGKTMSTIFPAVYAMGEEKLEKIFYLTAKTITASVALNSYNILREKGLKLKQVSITAKEKICFIEKPDCNPKACECAKGHYDRINTALFDMLTNEDEMSREIITKYAKKHKVCPFELGLDATNWADAIVCDYNYVFDPKVYLRRYFESGKKQDFVFLIDEAHNLVERARQMYSSEIYKDDFYNAYEIVKLDKDLKNCLLECVNLFSCYQKECEECEVWESAGDMYIKLIRLTALLEEHFSDGSDTLGKEQLLNLYFDIKHFIYIHDLLDENYIICTDYFEERKFRLRLMCMNPSENLKNCLNKGKSAVFFSATLLPVKYYMDQLGGRSDDYAVYAPSPFDTNKRLLMIGGDVSTKYNKRSDEMYIKIAEYIKRFTEAKTGNYMVFASSYKMLEDILSAYEKIKFEKTKFEKNNASIRVIKQESNMTEAMREEFLCEFKKNTQNTENEETLIGFCVMGGIFSEGIDLTKESLIGVVIVGTGLPMVCPERELFRGFYDRKSDNGFEYAYLYNGMNKVLQSAGRVIRTADDIGAILLLDERFLNSQYQNLFPREWYPYETVNINNISPILINFWKNKNL